MEIKTGIENKAQWDDYVRQNPQGGLFHLSGWLGAVEEVFKYKIIYLSAQEGARIAGVLQLGLCKNIFSKKILVSVPFGTCGGVLADSEEAREKLTDKAIELAKELGAQYLELRNREKQKELQDVQELYVDFKKELPADPKQCLGILPRKARAEARHAIGKGLQTQTGIHLLRQCYDLYAINSKRLGSPFLPYKFFQALAGHFKEQSTVLSIKINGKAAASVFIFFYKDTIMPLYSGALWRFTKYGTNNLMYLRVMELGSSMGFKYFDFGRSRKGSGPYHFKINQGFEPTQLYYQFYLNKAKEIPNLNPSNKKLGVFKTLWRHTPSILTNKLGPYLIWFVP